MGLEKAEEFFEKASVTDDVGQKRYLMFKAFDEVLSFQGAESVGDLDGYLYKNAQDFLTSSSTLEKRRKLEKILDHIS